MLFKATPGLLLRRQADLLGRTMPRIRDGDEEGIHAARVTTRRLRELLPLVGHGVRDRSDLESQFKEIGRALGQVRDADVQCALLRYLEARIPSAAPTLVVLRQQRERKRLALVRALIKQTEERDVDDLIATARKLPAYAR